MERNDIKQNTLKVSMVGPSVASHQTRPLGKEKQRTLVTQCRGLCLQSAQIRSAERVPCIQRLAPMRWRSVTSTRQTSASTAGPSGGPEICHTSLRPRPCVDGLFVGRGPEKRQTALQPRNPRRATSWDTSEASSHAQTKREEVQTCQTESAGGYT